jgi:hypothetical protein
VACCHSKRNLMSLLSRIYVGVPLIARAMMLGHAEAQQVSSAHAGTDSTLGSLIVLLA